MQPAPIFEQLFMHLLRVVSTEKATPTSVILNKPPHPIHDIDDDILSLPAFRMGDTIQTKENHCEAKFDLLLMRYHQRM